MNVYEKLATVQQKLKAPKNRHNSYGGFYYRSCEDILEAVKPLLDEVKATLIIQDAIIIRGERIYVEATACFHDLEKPDESGASIFVTAYAREPGDKKGMDSSQITGTASSYARKYALNGLFLIDDVKDPDSDEYRNQTEGKKAYPDNKKLIEVIKSHYKEGSDILNELLTYYKVDKLDDLTREQLAVIYNKCGGK